MTVLNSVSEATRPLSCGTFNGGCTNAVFVSLGHVGVINCVAVVIEAANPSSFQVLMKNAEDCSFSVWEVNINHLQLIRRDDEPDVP